MAINGQRRTPYRKYNEEHASENYRDDVFHESDAHGAHLSTGLNDVKTGKAYHFYTYSRPAKQKEDVLFKPDRSTSEANTIPPEFFGEIEASVFAPRFSRDSMKDDKMLSWLMRSFLPSENDLQKLPSGVALIGDAIHGTPILVSRAFRPHFCFSSHGSISQGGDGAEQAIQDAVTLGDMLANRKGEIQDTLTEFSTQALSRWEGSVKDSVARLEQMHSPKSQL